MAKGLLFKALLFIAESQDLNAPTIRHYPFHSKTSKSESPPSEWSSDSTSSTPLSTQRTPLAYSTSPANDDNFSLSSSGSDWSLLSNQAELDTCPPMERHPRGRSLSAGSVPAKDWGDASFAPWLENDMIGCRVEVQPKKDRSVQPTCVSRSCPPTDACPICVCPMSCMETLFAPSCGYLCHLSCMQRTLKNNLDNERGDRPLDIRSMRCPICFAMHPLAHGVQFSHVRQGDRFATGNHTPGRDGSPTGREGSLSSPNFLPGEFRRVLQPTKAAHIRGYASEADGGISPKRAESEFSQLRKTKSMDCGKLVSDEPVHNFRPGPKTKGPSPLSSPPRYTMPAPPPPKPPLSGRAHPARSRAEVVGFGPLQYRARGRSPVSVEALGHNRPVEQVSTRA